MKPKLETVIRNEVTKTCKGIASDTTKTMKRYAPHPTGAEKGLGSESTGATRDSITTRTIKRGKWEISVKTDYAYYADQGRGAIDLRGTGRLMSWVDKRGRRHVTPYVSAMEGWHFVDKTVNEIVAKYGR